MGQAISLPVRVIEHTRTFYRGFLYFLWGKGRSSPYPLLTASSSSTGSGIRPLDPLPSDSFAKRLFKQHARIHLYSLAANFYLYKKPHYRKVRRRIDHIFLVLWPTLFEVIVEEV